MFNVGFTGPWMTQKSMAGPNLRNRKRYWGLMLDEEEEEDFWMEGII
jgi:hypothetical protein